MDDVPESIRVVHNGLTHVQSKPPTRHLAGCLTVLYGIAAFFLLLAWFGPPYGMLGEWRGLRHQFASDLVYSTGKIVRIDGSSMGTSRFSTPIIEFSVNGHPMRVRGQGSNSSPFHVGQEVAIAYPNGDPERAWVRTFGQQYALPLLMIFFASPFVILAFIATRNARKQD